MNRKEEIKQIAYDFTTSKGDCKKLENRILSLFGVVKSLKEKRKLHFGEWKQSKGLRYMSGHTYKDSDGDLYDADEVEKMYQTYYDSF
jgi:hypothetical protein